MIEIHKIHKSYKMTEEGLVVLKDVDLKINEGEFVSIMGPSGSGKSTLLNIIGLLDVPDSGSYKVCGLETTQLKDDELAILRRKVFGFVFQQFNLLPKMTALQNVELPALYSKGQMNLNSAKELLVKVGLSERLEHKPQQLSGGQQQRVAIARALINNPRIILADEPTGNLDSKSGKEIISMLKELNKQGITIILVTHEESIAKEADRLIRVHDGLIVSDEKIKGSRRLKKVKDQTPVTVDISSSLTISEFIEHFKEGIKTLMANKVRTALSVLGILIGVSAVIAMLALGTGAKMAVEKQLSSLGSNLLVLRAGSIRIPGAGMVDDSSSIRLSIEDTDELKKSIPYIKEASPVVNGRGQVTYLDKNWRPQIMGTGPAYARMRSLFPEYGRFFTEDENRVRSRVAVIGLTVWRELFDEKDPIGAYIKINKISFQVIGVLPERGGTGFRDQDDVIIIPCLTAMYRLLGKNHVDYIDIEIDSAENIDRSQDLIKEHMIKQHKIPFSQQQDAFQIRNMADIQNAMSETSNILSMLLAAIAAVSLLVGGIGIMNIMLVSVTERTKEIGLRKAIGARRVDILSQFITEAGVIGVFGGLVGILLGFIITMIMSEVAGWSTYISGASVFLSFVFSVGVGVVFGIWPAKKASILNPIEALRHE